MIVRRVRIDEDESQRLIQTHPIFNGYPNANDYDDHEIGSLHAVMGLGVGSSNDGSSAPFVYLLLHQEDLEMWYPAMFPAELYQVVDPRLPSGWSVRYSSGINGEGLARIVFEEAVNDQAFFEQLWNAYELPREEGERLISIYKKRLREVKELSKDFYAAESNGTV